MSIPRTTRFALGAVAVMSSLAGCGPAQNVDINGKVGITVNAQGGPVVVAELCHGSVSRVSVYGPNRGNTPNRIDADLTATPQTASFAVDPATPDSTWTGQPLTAPISDELHIVIVSSGKKSQLQQATFTPEDLAALTPGTVQYDTDYRPTVKHATASQADFHQVACDAIAGRTAN